ncbi:MAG: hypothetical protein IT249_08020 [Chitinophagaceae bacterium]|nr:hypothetical protein [Chitinophagaceae bacterium]
MKTLIASVLLAAILQTTIAQTNSGGFETAVAKLNNAKTAKDYEATAEDFLKITETESNNWLAWYYAAFCNAQTGWLYQRDGEKIEPFANTAEEQINKALSLIDTSSQKKELSEVYCIMAMVNQDKVFINPQTYGPKFGPAAFRYMYLAQSANPQNPRALYLVGWQKFATPKAWGGDKAKAKELLLQANHLLVQEVTTGTSPHWGKTEVEALLKQIR